MALLPLVNLCLTCYWVLRICWANIFVMFSFMCPWLGIALSLLFVKDAVISLVSLFPPIWHCLYNLRVGFFTRIRYLLPIPLHFPTFSSFSSSLLFVVDCFWSIVFQAKFHACGTYSLFQATTLFLGYVPQDPRPLLGVDTLQGPWAIWSNLFLRMNLRGIHEPFRLIWWFIS